MSEPVPVPDQPLSYARWVAAIQLSVEEVMADFGTESGLSEDEVWADMAAAVLMEAPRAVAEEVCRCEIGFVPSALLRHWGEIQ